VHAITENVLVALMSLLVNAPDVGTTLSLLGFGWS
jgi:hypothetical protein